MVFIKKEGERMREKIILYVKENCPICTTVQKLLKASDIPFTIIEDEKEAIKIGRENKIMSMPFALVEGEYLKAPQIIKYIQNREEK